MPWFTWPKKDAETAIIAVEVSKTDDTAVSEWGNPVL